MIEFKTGIAGIPHEAINDKLSVVRYKQNGTISLAILIQNCPLIKNNELVLFFGSNGEYTCGTFKYFKEFYDVVSTDFQVVTKPV